MDFVNQFEVPKVYSACISAKNHHSGHHGKTDESQETTSIDNSFYTTYQKASEGDETSLMFDKFQNLNSNFDSDGEAGEGDGNSDWIYI